jgi:ketosteroid isomerase-like protein
LRTIDDNQVRNACADLVAAFAYNVDHRKFDKAVALFADDGCFERPDLVAKGHKEIAAIWAARPASVVTCHLCGPPFFTEISLGTASSVTTFTLYHLEHHGEGLPQCERLTAVAEFHDTFKRTGDGWRIAHRKAVPVLVGRK